MGKQSGAFQTISLVGEQEGVVKRLSGFDKSRHTVPKFASDRAKEFLGRICEEELVDWADSAFRDLRHAMGYKRREISMECDNGSARLVAKDFVLERSYTLIAESPEYYRINTELTEVPSFELFELETLNSALGPLFDRMRCIFHRTLDIENLIDEIEDKPESQMSVEYPGDCSYCEARIQDCDAVFYLDATELQIRFSVFGSPVQLYDAWKGLENTTVANPSIAAMLGFQGKEL